MSRTRRRPFRGLRPPGAPAELRRRTLDAARAAPADPVGPPEPHPRVVTDRLWESRPLRLAWALLVVALLGVNLLLDASPAELARPGEGASAGHGEPRTLLESRDAVLRALLGEGLEERPVRDASPRFPEHPRRKS
ncbi:MAG: hypothetical protein PVG07_08865 [Acidobacteriota bacterium]|jgi:hypothetical protein